MVRRIQETGDSPNSKGKKLQQKKKGKRVCAANKECRTFRQRSKSRKNPAKREGVPLLIVIAGATNLNEE